MSQVNKKIHYHTYIMKDDINEDANKRNIQQLKLELAYPEERLRFYYETTKNLIT